MEPEDQVAEGRAPGEQTWLVQSGYMTTVDGEPRQAWLDVGAVTVPPRTRRRTILEKALAEYPAAAPHEMEDDVLFRVLDAGSTAAIPVGWEVPPAPEPVLRIGGAS